jgi:putative ABC transport system ATP-binding protein
MDGCFIDAVGLTKIYPPETIVLRDVDLSVAEDEWVSVMGPSGSGKTTLLNILGCLDSPTNGDLTINGNRISEMDQGERTQFRRENIGLVFQQYHLIPYLTVLENVMIAQYFHSLVARAEAMDVLRRVGLDHRLKHLPAQISGGEKQRVCIARALVNEPKILLADEPTGNLDRKNGMTVLNLIEELHDEGHTIILVSHNPEIAGMGDRIVHMLDGRIEKQNQQN